MNEKQASTLCWAIKALLAGILVYVAVETATKPLHLRQSLKPHAAAGEEQGPPIAGTPSAPRPPLQTPCEVGGSATTCPRLPPHQAPYEVGGSVTASPGPPAKPPAKLGVL